MAKNIEIRNSTAEFLIFQIEGKENGVQVMYQNETIWCTQKAMAQLFDCSTDNVGLHLKNIYESGELVQVVTTEYFSVVQVEGERQVNRNLSRCLVILLRIQKVGRLLRLKMSPRKCLLKSNYLAKSGY